MLRDFTLNDFVAEVASSAPAPGGGSVAALAGAEGFALLAMVARLTIGRKKYAAVEGEMGGLLDFASERQVRLLQLVDKDTAGFKGVMAALSLPKDTDEERALRRAELEKATLQAAQVPLETAGLCLEGLRRLPGLLRDGNQNALSDMGVAAQSLRTGLEGALYNVQINALGLEASEEKEKLLHECQLLRVEGRKVSVVVEEEILSRLR
ncbi:methenyltetrahydrofolate cyclohydrolase [Peptococcaceae bacterium CEB3]|nr:methenyltetrahydrofolate cyclohydrolase [Peptococcaceae bacterium CEB3]